jgi:hypothetical protein
MQNHVTPDPLPRTSSSAAGVRDARLYVWQLRQGRFSKPARIHPPALLRICMLFIRCGRQRCPLRLAVA